MNKKKSQVAIEFLVLIVFGFVLISLIMYGISIYIVDLKQQQQQQRIDDVAQSIRDEFRVAQETQNGFSRTVTIEPHLVERYNISLNESTGYLVLQDLYGSNPQRKHYYVIEGVENFTYNVNSTTQEGEINLTSTNSNFNNGSMTLNLSKKSAFQDCTLDGVTVNHYEDYSFYNSQTVPYGSTCNSQTRTCDDGSFTGDSSYEHSSCSEESQDTTPDAFSFSNRNGVNISTLITSSSRTPTGYNGVISVGITGDGSPQLSINSGSWVTSGSISSGDSMKVRMNSSSNYNTIHTASISAGSYSTTWNVSTGYGYSWQTDAWGSCSQTCGGGTQTRNVYCERSDGVTVDDSYCDSSTKPTGSQSCNTQSCCTSQDYSACYNGDAYWYDSCGNRENIRDSCSSTEYCSGGACYLDDSDGDGVADTNDCAPNNGNDWEYDSGTGCSQCPDGSQWVPIGGGYDGYCLDGNGGDSGDYAAHCGADYGQRSWSMCH